MELIRFKFAAAKALAAIHEYVSREPGIDLHTLLKACYFADREHLNSHFRPIFGATYRAMRFGPVPIEIYEMAKGECLWLAELDIDRFPWRLDGFRLSLAKNEKPDLSPLSETDREALDSGFKKSCALTFNERTAATHGRDWQAAGLGLMSYADMLDDTPQRDEIARHLAENARFLRL
jgi:hypothetical protein